MNQAISPGSSANRSASFCIASRADGSANSSIVRAACNTTVWSECSSKPIRTFDAIALLVCRASAPAASIRTASDESSSALVSVRRSSSGNDVGRAASDRSPVPHRGIRVIQGPSDCLEVVAPNQFRGRPAMIRHRTRRSSPTRSVSFPSFVATVRSPAQDRDLVTQSCDFAARRASSATSVEARRIRPDCSDSSDRRRSRKVLHAVAVDSGIEPAPAWRRPNRQAHKSLDELRPDRSRHFVGCSPGAA